MGLFRTSERSLISISSLWEIWNNRRRLTLITMFVRNFLVDWFSGSICELWEIFINLSCLLGMFEIVDFAVKSINFLVDVCKKFLLVQ